MASLAVFALVALLSLAHAGKLRPVAAGVGGKVGAAFKSVDTLCLTDYPNGFNIECVPDADESYSSVVFNVNGNFERKESVAPYMIAGDQNGMVYKWDKALSGTTVITCMPNTGPNVQVSLTTSCSTSPPPPPTEETMPKEEPKPKPTGPQSKATITQDCIVIPAPSHVSPRTTGWELTADGKGLVFEKDNNFAGVYGNNKARLSYSFTPKKTAVYGFTIEMKTAHATEHNDCFVQADFGFTLRREGNVKNGGTGFLKAYHNSYKKNGNKPVAQAFSIDHNAHSFSTSKELEAGKTYTITIGARSTKLEIYNLVFFPCSGLGCDHTQGMGWNAGLGKCRKYF